MKKSTIVWLVIATVCVISGSIIFTGALAVNGWNFTKYQTNEHTVNDEFRSVSVNTDTASVIIKPSDNGETKVVCYEKEKKLHTVEVVESELVIRVENNRKWYDYIFNIDSPEITVYLPEGEYSSLNVKASTGYVKIPSGYTFGSMDISSSTGMVDNGAFVTGEMKIKTSTGAVKVEDSSAGSLDITVSTGKVTINNVTCKGDISVSVSTGRTNMKNVTCRSFISSGSTGDINLENVIAEERFNIKRNTGDIIFERCDAGEIYMKTSTGEIGGSLLTEKIFIAKSDTGDVDVPRGKSGGTCETITETGDIDIVITK